MNNDHDGEHGGSNNKGGVRDTDPSTSHDAAEPIDTQRLEAVVLIAHMKIGEQGLTWDECAALTRIDKASVSPRFKPLMRKGLLKIKHDENGKPVKRGTGRRPQLVRVTTELTAKAIEMRGVSPVVPVVNSESNDVMGGHP